MIVERSRLSTRLATSSTRAVTLVVAPAGYGKSIALDRYLAGIPEGVLRLDVKRTHGSLARFVRALAAAFEPTLPRMGQSLSIAYERAVQSANPSDILATWLAEHLEGPSRTVVIDDFHHCEGDRAVGSLIAKAVARSGSHIRWIIAARSSADLPLASWLARRDAHLPIDERDLRFTEEEAHRLAALVSTVPRDVVTRLIGATDGAPAVFSFALQTIAQDPASAERLLDAGGDSFGKFANEVFSRFSLEEQRRLVETAALPAVDDALIAQDAQTSSLIDSIALRAPQILDVRNGLRAYHGLFLNLLREKLKEMGSEAARDVALRAAQALERAGRIGEALSFYVRDRHDAELVRLIEAHGFAFLEAGLGESIHEAIDALDPLVQINSSAVLAIKAMSESSTGRFDTAESWFQLALDRTSDPLRAQIAYQYGCHLLRFFRHEAVVVFEELVADPTVPEELRAYVLAALGAAYVFERRPADARRTADEALALAKTLNAPHLLAKVHHQASFVAFYAGEARRARDLAMTARAFATEHGYFDVAAGALSVLYSVASDIEDDPVESIRLLEEVADCAAKSGSLINQLISLVAALEIEVERNNEDVADRIDAKLQTLDASFAGRTTYESLLPTQALRATWSGDFVGAFRLLANTADVQWSSDRRALRFAEIAVYAAGAGLETHASDALRAAGEALAETTTVDLRVQRARLMCALGAIILGRSESAADWLADVDTSADLLSRRLAALRRTLGALLLRYRGARNHDEVLTHLAELDESGFAGFSRAIAMLPLADNAQFRVARLSVAERRTAVKSVAGTPKAHRGELVAIAGKLGCEDRGGVARAVVWHRAAFDAQLGTRTGEDD